MKHLGDISKIDWFSVEPVDVVTGGSPCQDLSVAGKRAGLAGERSGLYMEQIRCVKELRQADVQRGRTGQFIRPRYMVWENVPGAFSSGKPKGADFAAVIEEIIKICEPDASVCIVPPSNGWTKSGCYYADDGRWSIAWRVHDAQFWGVPQRRKRIALIADFGGLSAPEVLFERKGLSGDFEQSGAQREAVARDAENGAGADDRDGENAVGLKAAGFDVYNMAATGDVTKTLTAIKSDADHVPVVFYGTEAAPTGNIACSLTTAMGQGASNTGPSVMQTLPIHDKATRYKGGGPTRNGDGAGNGLGVGADGDPMYTVTTGDHHAVAYAMQGFGDYKESDVASGLKARDYKDATDLVAESVINYVTRYIVRRLTPNEAERLQGYPDGWTLIGKTEEVEVKDYITIQVPGDDCPYKSEAEAFDAWCETTDYDEDGNPVSDFDIKDFGFVDRKISTGTHTEIQYFYRDADGKKKRCTDSARYKALGNSIALPFWKYLLKRISAQYERDATLGSLFDGIGGFPLCWEQINGQGSARWASEIEEFPIAVTKLRFPEREER